MLSPAEEIKTRLDIVEFIQGYVRLQKAGMNYRAPCPFHAEKTPSFFVSPARQIWHCFGGCGAGGDIFTFVMKMEALDFPEALRMLAARAGVQLKREDPGVRSERNRLSDICEAAARIFERTLLLTSGPKEYLKARGVSEGTVRGFRIGFAPESWDFLISSLAKKGFSAQEVEKAGLAVRSEDGRSWYDRFRSRIIFPIADAHGRVIGFGGRIYESGIRNRESAKTEAKYINTPQTLLYDKSRVLYGFDKAKQEIRARGSAVVVEGYMDCVMSHQAGVKNAIAVSGTALTPQQLTVIKRLCDTVICSFDTDAAGETATKRSLALAAGFGFDRQIAAIPSGKDPADTVREDPALWVGAVAEAKPVVDFYFEKMFREHSPERAEGKQKISATLIPILADLSDEIQKAHWVRELAKRFAMGEDAIWKELLRRPDPPAPRDTSAGASGAVRSDTPVSRRDLLEERFLSLLSLLPEEARHQERYSMDVQFASQDRQDIFNFFVGISGDMPAHCATQAEALRLKGEMVQEMKGNTDQEFVLCRKELRKECVRVQLIDLGEQIRSQEHREASGDMQPLLENFRAKSQELKNLA